MKYISLIFCLVISFISYSQEHKEPVKNDNTIIVESSESVKVNFKEFVGFLIDEGYNFITKDEEYNILETDFKKTKTNLNYKYNIRARFKDDRIIITSNWALATTMSLNVGAGVTTSMNDASAWKYKKSGVYGKLHNEIVEVLKKYCSDCSIKYDKK